MSALVWDQDQPEHISVLRLLRKDAREVLIGLPRTIMFLKVDYERLHNLSQVVFSIFCPQAGE